jgi:hypothetical protein
MHGGATGGNWTHRRECTIGEGVFPLPWFRMTVLVVRLIGVFVTIIALSLPVSLLFLLILMVRKRRKGERVAAPKRLLRFYGIAAFTLILCVGVCWGYDRYEDSKSIETGEANIGNTMKDPGTVQFRNVRVIRFCRESGCFWYERTVCGEVNAKNAYGAYGGFQRFIIAQNGHSLLENDATADDFLALWTTAACEGKGAQ